MPTYEYACASCGNRYEKREGFDARPRQKCPKCGKMAQRLLSRPAVVFKGSGFYKTDSRGSSKDASSGEPSSKPSTPSPAPTPAADAGGDGHSHGPGGHTHGAPPPSEKKTATDTTTETAAAT